MFGAEKWADAFDEMYHDNMKWYRHEMEGWVQGIYTKDGEGAKLYAAAVVAGVGDALFDFVQGSGAGLVDVLRLGEGVKEGTPWGVAKDGLRVIMVVGGALRVVRVAAAELEIGGQMSCTFSSSAKAATISGNRLPLSVAFNELAQTAGGRAAVSSPAFTGTSSPLTLVNELRNMGATVTQAPVTSLADVSAMAAKARGPVVFGVEWSQGGGHTMVAYRNLLGQIRFADQMGRTVSEVSQLGSIGKVYPMMAVVEDANMVKALRAGAMVDMLGVNVHNALPKVMQMVEKKAYAETGRQSPFRRAPAKPASGSFNLSALAKKIYDAMGPGSMVLTYRQIMQRAHVFIDDVILGLDELSRTGKVQLVHRKGDVNEQQAFKLS
jgi:hypothetical protein